MLLLLDIVSCSLRFVHLTNFQKPHALTNTNDDESLLLVFFDAFDNS